MGKIKNLFGIVCLVFVGLAFSHASPVEKHDRTSICKTVDSIYTSQIGVVELTGRNDGVQVEQYLATTFLPKGNPWCAAFIAWTFDKAGVDALHSAWAPSWFPISNTIYTKGKLNKLKPDRADVFGIYFNNLHRIGHVGFVDEWPPNGDYVITVEGNTNSSGSREGNGVFRKRRLKENIHKVSRWI